MAANKSATPVLLVGTNPDDGLAYPVQVSDAGVVATALGGATAYTQLLDDQTTYLYIGEAAPGTATSADTWRIKKVAADGSYITWADGVSSFTKQWDDRATYTYS